MAERSVQEIILDEIKLLRADVKELQAWRWKLVGISSAVGFLWGVVFSVGIAYMKYVA